MGLHGYCVVPASREPRAAGIDGVPVRPVVLAPLAVWVSSHATPPVPTLGAARAHDGVIRSACDEQVTPVPLRFGQWFEDEPRLIETVRDRVPAWLALLDQLAGRIEMSVRVTSAAPAVAAREAVETGTAGGSGTAYMQALLERHRASSARQRQREDLLAALRATLGGSFEREFVEPDTGGATMLVVAYLLRRAAVEAFREALQPLHHRFAELRINATGPWPPYSFVA